MGSWGALIMGFFGAVFVSLTLSHELAWVGFPLIAPFGVFAALAGAALIVLKRPGAGVTASQKVGRVIMWSSIAEGVGLFLVANIVTNLGRPEWLLPGMALVVGVHFLPIGASARFVPFLVLGGSLIAAAIFGFVAARPLGAAISGFAAAGALWVASVLAIARDLHARRRDIAGNDRSSATR